MEENLEIYFCEICSESIPAKDLETRDAIKVKGKVIGPCCLADVRGPESGKSTGSNTGLTALGVILLAAFAGGVLHLEWRLSEEVAGLDTKIQAVETNVARSGSKHWADMEKRLDNTLQKGAMDPVLKRVGELETKLDKDQIRLGARIDTIHVRFEGIEQTQKRLVDGQFSIVREIKDVESEVLRLERDVAAAAAAPRGGVEPSRVGDASGKPTPKIFDEPKGLLPALAHQVARLKDGDAGNRFEAVDHLVQSKNPAVLEHILPMLKDPDAFVRRLTAEGLADFRDKASVEALIIALADPESIVRHTAHGSLKKLTGQSIAFDPDGSASSRSKAQRRFKDWWSKNRDKF